MLRYKTETRPGLVALYDIRPGNGAGLFLQSQSPHRACACQYSKHTGTVPASCDQNLQRNIDDLLAWCLTALSAQTGYIVPYEYEIYHVGPGEKRQTHNKNNTIN